MCIRDSPDGLKIVYPSLNMRNSGCAALDLAYVGSGRLDGFFNNNINLWDIAAGIILIEEAGGIINKIDLAPLVGASIDVMDRDAKKMRDDKPFVFSNLKSGQGLEEIKKFILDEGML